MDATEMKYQFLLRYDKMYSMTLPAMSDKAISTLLTSAQRQVFLNTYYAPSNNKKRGFDYDEKRKSDLDNLIYTININCSKTSGNISYTGDTTEDSTTISNLSSIEYLSVGSAITGDGIADSTTITEIVDSTTIEISNAATATAETVELLSGLGKSSNQNGVHTNGIFLDLPDNFMFSGEELALLDGSYVNIKPINMDYYNLNINNPYKNPNSELVWRMEHNSNIRELITDGSSTLTKYYLRYLKSPDDIVVNSKDTSSNVDSELNVNLHDNIVDVAVKIAKASTDPQQYNISKQETIDSYN